MPGPTAPVLACVPERTAKRRRARFNRAVRLEDEVDEQWVADRIVMITQLAEELDRGTFEVALHIVPVEWRGSRPGTAVPSVESQTTAAR
jgi:hypothetical protein